MVESIREGLRGKRILLTGVTGFLGMALFERLLADVPDTKIVVLARGRYGSPAEDRIRELITRSGFNALRERIGDEGIRGALAERVTIIEGDVAEDLPSLPDGIDVVFHCAATVSFDSPVDVAFAINVTGARRLSEEELALGAGVPLSVVRPAIVESALEHPYPGWIEGFKMAEPIILAYGRGAIPEFPAIPEGILDIIPVDLVVNAMLAVAVAVPPVDAPGYYHVCSGSRNPLTFHGLYELVREYFRQHPLPERGRG